MSDNAEVPESSARPTDSAQPRYRDEARDAFLHGVPTLILLVALTAIIHFFHVIPSNDDWFARLVAPYVPLDDGESGRPPLVQVLEIDAPTRAMVMEKASSASEKSELHRTGGVRAIDRQRMVEFLRKIDTALKNKAASHEPLPKVIGIDVDLAPLESEASPAETAIVEVLDALRVHAPVVVIIGDRPQEERRRRNLFMQAVGCTQPGDLPTVTKKGLYFASPALFAEANKAPFRFVAEISDRKRTTPPELPPVFPSLGTLMFLAQPPELMKVERTAWWGPHPYRFEKHIEPPEKQDSLVLLCRQSRPDAREAEGHKILVDYIADDRGSNSFVESTKQAFRQPMYNWRLLNGFTIQRTVLNRHDLDTLFPKQSAPGVPELQIADSRALLISIAGVGNVDKYFVPYLPSLSEQSPSGAMLHGLTTASLIESVDEVSWSGLGIDFAIGFVFLLWTAAINPSIDRMRTLAPFIGKVFHGVFPLCLAAGLTWVSLHVSAWALQRDIWFNPVFVLIGLAAHAYIEPWSSPKEDGHPVPAMREQLLFGAPRALRALSTTSAQDRKKIRSALNIVDGFLQASVSIGILLVGIVVFIIAMFSRH